MKAIVLSCDKYHPVADHMIRCYQRVWPDNPLVFRVPYQEFPGQVKGFHGKNVELINSPRNIKETVLTLLDGIDDQEWIYWCMDDKYPVALNIDVVSKLYEYITYAKDLIADGFLFCRCRKLMNEENIRINRGLIDFGREKYLLRANYYQFWIHQFMRAGILRKLFKSFPDTEFGARDMDSFTGQKPGMLVKAFCPDENMYVTVRNHARFGESTLYGELTRNCYESMLSMGLSSANLYSVVNKQNFMGEIDFAVADL